MRLLEVKNLKKSFGDNEVLKNISFDVDKGEVLSIIGPSGSGKSTLLRCATGLEEQDSGDINYDGTFGLVFQNFNLFPKEIKKRFILKQENYLRKWAWKIKQMFIQAHYLVVSNKGFLLQELWL